MRNRFYLFWLMLLVAVSVEAQIQTLTISGTVTNSLSGAPIVNHEVVVQTDSMTGGVPYYNVVATSPNGAYSDMISFAPGTTGQGLLSVSTLDCNGSMQIQQFAFGPGNMNFTADFSLCGDTIPVGCQSAFYYYPDSNSTNIHFVDVSIGDPVSWLWSFGDGQVSTEQNPTHLYAQNGDYMAELTISTAAGCTSVSTQLVVVGSPAGCLSSFYYYPDSLNLGFQFVDVSFGNPVDWQWDFGDGAVSAQQNPLHAYAQPGQYVVTLTIIGADSCSSTSSQVVWVGQPSGCQAMFTWHPAGTPNNPNPNQLQFVDLSVGTPSQWFWDFGDGITSSEQNPVHTYSEPGNYMVCLTISSADSSCNDMICQPVLVLFPGGDCQANFYFFPGDTLNMIIPNTLQFVDQSLGNPVSWFWDFGDGTTSTEQSPVHTFAVAGTYLVCLTIQGADSNCFDTRCEAVWAGNPMPGCQAMFFYYPADSLNLNNTIQFVDQSVGEPSEWYWDFGDGSTSTEQHPLHTFANPGIYNVCLTVVNPTMSCADTICLEVWVNGIIPIDCENAFSTQSSGLTVTFNGYMLNGDTATYTWEFGDGMTATGETVTHTYAAPGNYPVILTTLTNWGCQFTSSQLVFVGDTLAMQTVQGQVFAGNGSTVQGMVMLMPLAGIWNWGAQVVIIDSAGYYHFEGVAPGSYHLLAIPFSVNGDTMAYLPTYYGDVVFWEQATVVTLGTALSAYNINLVPCNGIIPGLGLINGNIGSNGLKSGMSDVHILLLDAQNQPLAYDRSDAAGSFDFSTLAYGTYTIWAEMHGVNTTPVTLVLSPESPNATVNLTLNGTSVMGIGDPGMSITVESGLYPNPATDRVSIGLNAKQAVNATISIYNLSGQQVMETSHVVSGSETITLSIGNLPAGFYNLVVRGDDGTTLRQKFVKASR